MKSNMKGRPTDLSALRGRINTVALSIRRANPGRLTFGRDPVDVRYKRERLHGVPALAVNLTLHPTGCEWAKSGGCTMCGEFSGSTLGKTVETTTLLQQLEQGIQKNVRDSNRAVNWVRIYNEGNFTNTAEIRQTGQDQIIQRVASVQGVERITVEAMAKYLHREDVARMRASMPGSIELEVGLGYESGDEFVRNVCINKGEQDEIYLSAIKNLRDFGVRSVAYVLLKPPFLSERESIRDCNATVAKAIRMGFDAVSIEPVSIHAWSVVDLLHYIGEYEVPWLWSVVDVLKATASLGEVRVGGLEYYPRPGEIARNRHESGDMDCNRSIWMAIMEYGGTHDPTKFATDCRCRTLWQDALTQSESGCLVERVSRILDKAEAQVTEYLAWRGASPGEAAERDVMTEDILRMV